MHAERLDGRLNRTAAIWHLCAFPGNWQRLFPEGRCIFYEGDDPEGFAEQIKAEFGFNPREDHRWGRTLMHGPDGEDWEDPLGRSYAFHCPPEHLDAIYGNDRFPMGS